MLLAKLVYSYAPFQILEKYSFFTIYILEKSYGTVWYKLKFPLVILLWNEQFNESFVGQKKQHVLQLIVPSSFMYAVSAFFLHEIYFVMNISYGSCSIGIFNA